MALKSGGSMAVTPYAMPCAAIHARTSLTLHPVTRWDNLTGAGNVPSFTLRQSVGALKGSGAGAPGRFGLCTSCDSRMNALSGRWSNDGIVGVDLCAGVLDAIGVLGDAIWGDISEYLLSEADMDWKHYPLPY
jgi:hypothetical protein